MYSRTTGGTATGTIALQLFLSHLIVSLSTIALYLLLQHTTWSSSPELFLYPLAGGALGLLLTSNLQYSLYLLQLALARFQYGQPIEQQPIFQRWPLVTLFQQVNDINQRIKIYAQSEQLNREFREQTLRQAREAAALEERDRIARELHDSIKQQIFSISMSAAAAKAQWNNNLEDAREAIDDIQQSTKEAQIEMQALLQQLRPAPLENTNLAEALRIQGQALAFRTNATITITIGDLPASDRLPPGAQETIFRMVQEAFANIARHARPNTIWLTVQQQEQKLAINVRDDGQGFDPTTVTRGMGLANLEERVQLIEGDVLVESAPGKGTSVRISIPLLASQQILEERERSEREIRRSIEQAQRSLQLGENASPFAILLMIVNYFFGFIAQTPALTVGIVCCVIATLYSILQSRYHIARIVFSTGKESRVSLSLRQREHGLRLWLLRLFVFMLCYLVIIFHIWMLPLFLWLVAAVSILLLILFIFEHVQRKNITDHYYELISPSELVWELAQQKRRIATRVRLWLITLAILVFTGNIFFVFPVYTIKGWISYINASLLLYWGLIIAYHYRQFKQWQQKTISHDLKATPTVPEQRKTS